MPARCAQFVTCLSKDMMVYWRNTEYNAVRLFSTCFLAFLFGSIYWGLGSTRWASEAHVNPASSHMLDWEV